MSNSSGQKDPSTDEILSSIRRIISEDNAQAGDVAEAPAAAAGDDILELTDEVGAAPEVDEDRPEPVMAPFEPSLSTSVGEALDERMEPVLGLHAPATPEIPETEPLAVEPEPAPVFEAEPAPPAMEEAAPEPAPEIEPEPTPPVMDEAESAVPHTSPSMFGTAPKQEEDVMASSDETAAAPAEQPAAAFDEIVSDAATSATTAALGQLNRAVDEKASQLRVGEGGATVSDLVKEMIRPMLREWLDQNLPGIVERVVRREIQKLVDRTQDDD